VDVACRSTLGLDCGSHRASAVEATAGRSRNFWSLMNRDDACAFSAKRDIDDDVAAVPRNLQIYSPVA
jgi:hypothetical protein